MLGPVILANTMTKGSTRGKSGSLWQYHSRSDQHSKVACWTILFDLLHECPIFRRHASEGKIAFAINHVLAGRIQKALDLVICHVPSKRDRGQRPTFASLAETYDVQLGAEFSEVLATLPAIEQERTDDVSQVLIALEAKACMTEHSKSMPRLFAEILATGYLAKRSSDNPITGCYAIVNASETFKTPSTAGKENRHTQPRDAKLVVDMIGTAIPTMDGFDFGYDAVGVSVINCRNDGSPVTLSSGPPAPGPRDAHNYERMIRALCSKYGSRFGNTL